MRSSTFFQMLMMSGGGANPYISGDINFVAAGNSLTAGTGSSDAATKSWPKQMYLAPYAGTATVTVKGHSAWRTSQLTAVIDVDVMPNHISGKMNILALYEGGNSMYYGATPQEAWDEQVAYYAEARLQGWRGHIATCTIGPRSNVSQASINDFNSIARASWEAAGFAYLADFADVESLRYPRADAVHYNDDQYATVADYWAEATLEFLGAGTWTPDWVAGLIAGYELDTANVTLSSGKVTVANDLYGAGNDLGTTGGAEMTHLPTWRNGRGAAQCASGKRLFRASFLEGLIDTRTTIVWGDWAIAGGSKIWLDGGNGGSNRNAIWQSSGGFLAAYAGTGATSTVTAPVGSVAIAAYEFGISGGTNGTAHVESHGGVPLDYAAAFGTQDMDGVALGTDHAGTTPWDGTVAGSMIFDRVLAPTRKERVLQYIRDGWNIQKFTPTVLFDVDFSNPALTFAGSDINSVPGGGSFGGTWNSVASYKPTLSTLNGHVCAAQTATQEVVSSLPASVFTRAHDAAGVCSFAFVVSPSGVNAANLMFATGLGTNASIGINVRATSAGTFEAHVSNGTVNQVISSATGVYTAAFSIFHVTKNGTAIKGYLAGVEVLSGTLTAPSAAAPANTAHLGYPSTGSFNVGGKYGQARMYAEALTPAQVKADYAELAAKWT
jgi:hypothetical protein